MSDSEYRQLCKDAQLLVRQQKFDEAIALFEQAAELEKFEADAHEGMGTAFFMKGDLERSCEEFKRTTELDPRRGRAYVNLGAVYNRLKKYKEAAAALRKAVQKERKSAPAYYNLGIAQKGLNQLSMSMSAYKEAIKLAPEMAEAHQNLGNVYLEMKNYSQATRCFDKALELRPGFERAILGLKRAKEMHEDARSAFSPFGRLVNEEDINANAAETKYRQLTSDERFQDRKSLRALATQARDAAGELASFVDEDLTESISDLTQVIINSKGSTELIEASEAFFEEFAVMKEIRTRLANHMQKVEQHEAKMLSD